MPATIDLKDFTPAGLVNLPPNGKLLLPTDDLADLVNALYKGIEAGIKIEADGALTISDLQYLLPLALALPAVFTGAGNIIPEWKSATDEDITALVNLGDGYELGNLALKAKAAMKLFLTIGQTAGQF